MLDFDGRIVMLCGGVGGARGALALYENLPAEQLRFIVNTGDDFRHLGLEIWPDWDTVLYHLAGVHEANRGWGRADEGGRVMEELKKFGSPTWFHLGDRDLALHLHRTWRLQEGDKTHEVCQGICEGLGVQSALLPLTQGSLNTKLRTEDGRTLDFQDWFVGEQAGPKVTEVLNVDASKLNLTTGVLEALYNSDYLVMAPSNPYLSLNTMFGHQDFAKALKSLTIPKLAVSPLVGGKAIKGPLDKLIETLSPHQGQQAMVHFWSRWVDGIFVPPEEVDDITDSTIKILPSPTMLKTRADRKLFAETVCHQLKNWSS